MKFWIRIIFSFSLVYFWKTKIFTVCILNAADFVEVFVICTQKDNISCYSFHTWLTWWQNITLNIEWQHMQKLPTFVNKTQADNYWVSLDFIFSGQCRNLQITFEVLNIGKHTCIILVNLYTSQNSQQEYSTKHKFSRLQRCYLQKKINHGTSAQYHNSNHKYELQLIYFTVFCNQIIQSTSVHIFWFL